MWPRDDAWSAELASCYHSSDAGARHRGHRAAWARRSPRASSATAGRCIAAGRADGDVSRSGEARALVERAVEELGGLDLLVNAAGEGFAPKPVEELDEADWDAAFGATAKGSFFVTQAAAPHLRELARLRRDDRGRRRLPAVAVVRARTAPPRRPRRC